MAQSTQDPRAIRERVRAHYGSRTQSARAASDCWCCCWCCCSGERDTRTEVACYGAEMLAGLPADVNTTSFDCGNPIRWRA